MVPFLVRFLRFMNAQGPGAFNTSWVSYRWGDGLDIAVWLYRRTGESFLLDLAAKMRTHGADWTGATRRHGRVRQVWSTPASMAWQYPGAPSAWLSSCSPRRPSSDEPQRRRICKTVRDQDPVGEMTRPVMPRIDHARHRFVRWSGARFAVAGMSPT